MSYDDNAEREAHYRPGSAATTELPKACVWLAGVLLVVIVVSVPYMPLNEVWPRIVLAVWVACLLGLLAVGGWAQKACKAPKASLADLMPQRVLATVIACLALVVAILLIPL